MTVDEFDFEISKLRQVFGPNSFAKERSSVLYSIVEDCDLKPFKFEVAKWIADLKTAPLGEHFRAFAIRNHMARASSAKVVDSEAPPECVNCTDRGWVFLTMRPELEQYAESYNYPLTSSAICDCNKGRSVKAFMEASNDYREMAKRQINDSHHQWYTVTRWKRPTYTGKTWKEFFKDKGDSNILEYETADKEARKKEQLEIAQRISP